MHRLVLALLVAGCLAASCGDDGTAGATSGSTARVEPSDAADGAQRPTDLRFTEGHPLGDRLRLALVRPESYQPWDLALTDQAAVIVADLLYDGLTEVVGVEGRLRPGIASRWRANDDFTVWTFTIDPASGLDANEVADSLTALAGGAVPGEARAGAAAVLVAGLKDVRAVGDQTVVVETLKPNAGLPWILSGLPYSIVAADGGPTGDYRVATDDANGLLLQRRTDADTRVDTTPDPDTDVDAGPAVPNEVLVSWVADAEAAGQRLLSGAVDAAVIVDSGRQLDADSSDGLDRFDRPGLATTATRFYVMNARSASLSDPTIRQAVLSALDRPALVEQGFTQAVVGVDGLIAPSLAGYRPDGDCGAVCGHDPVGAARAVAGGTGQRLQVSYTGDDQLGLASAIVGQLAAVGFQAEYSQLQAGDLASVIVSGQTDLFAFGWVAPATSSDAVVPVLLRADSPANIARIDSAEIMALLDQAAMTGDDHDRWEVLAEAHRLAMAEALIVPIAASTNMLLKDAGLGGLVVRPDGSLDLDSGR